MPCTFYDFSKRGALSLQIFVPVIFFGNTNVSIIGWWSERNMSPMLAFCRNIKSACVKKSSQSVSTFGVKPKKCNLYH